MNTNAAVMTYETFNFASSHGRRTVTCHLMMDYIEHNYPEDKSDFKRVALEENDDGTRSYKHQATVSWFYNKYFPKTKAESASVQSILDW